MVNQVVVIGRLTRDPELRHTPSGKSVCTFRIAVDRAGDYDAEKGEKGAGFFSIEAWDTQAENCAQYIAKGRQVAVVGSLLYHEWESQGDKRNEVKVKAFSVQFLAKPGESGGSGDAGPPSEQTTSGGAGADDDIPF